MKNATESGGCSVEIPDPDQFRRWLADSLERLGITPVALARDVGLSKNALGRFLSSAGRDIRLGTAAHLVTELNARARAAEIELAPTPCSIEGAPA